MRAVAKANMCMKRRYPSRVTKPLYGGRWLKSSMKEMGKAIFGTLGVKQMAIIYCLVVKVGKV